MNIHIILVISKLITKVPLHNIKAEEQKVDCKPVTSFHTLSKKQI